MKYLSVCSGIEAATVAWHHLGWTPTAFAEVEPFPSAVLKHHYPTVINHGDMTKFMEWPDEAVDLLVGGTPCQSFSVAGLRQGLKDPRGNLMLTYLAIADRYRPRWLVWENVPGVLSSNSGRDFGTFLGALVELGYGFAFRILDAQWFGVAQRRRRVFVIGYLGDASRAAKVLFERESVCRNPAPSREKGKGVATNIADCLRSGGNGGVPSSRGEHLVSTLCRSSGQANAENLNEVSSTLSCLHESPIIATYDMKQHHNPQPSDTAQLTTKNCANVRGDTPLTAISFEPGIAGREGNESRFTHEVTGTLRKDMGDNQTAVAFSFDSLSSNSMKSKNPVSGCNQVEVSKTLDTSRGLDPSCNQGGMAVAYGLPGNWIGRKPENGGNATQPMDNISPNLTSTDRHAVAFHPTQDPISSKNISHALGAGSKSGTATTAVAFENNRRDGTRVYGDTTNTLQAFAGTGGGNSPMVQHSTAVRRLTPTECERLQGFSDGYTAIPWKKKTADQCPDGPRYKALGNSMAVPVMRWIGERIDKVNKEQA